MENLCLLPQTPLCVVFAFSRMQNEGVGGNCVLANQQEGVKKKKVCYVSCQFENMYVPTFVIKKTYVSLRWL